MIVIFEGIREQQFNGEQHNKNDMEMFFHSNDNYEGQIEEKHFFYKTKRIYFAMIGNDVEIHNLFKFEIEKK